MHGLWHTAWNTAEPNEANLTLGVEGLTEESVKPDAIYINEYAVNVNSIYITGADIASQG